MLGRLVQSTFVAGALLAGLAAIPAQAAGPAAPGLTIEVQYRDGDGRRGRDRGWDRHERRDVCRSGLALRKARDMGVRRPDIVRSNGRVVVVDGVRRGRPVAVRFAQARGCPVIGVR